MHLLRFKLAACPSYSGISSPRGPCKRGGGGSTGGRGGHLPNMNIGGEGGGNFRL